MFFGKNSRKEMREREKPLFINGIILCRAFVNAKKMKNTEISAFS
jgi:hypothetical protein